MRNEPFGTFTKEGRFLIPSLMLDIAQKIIYRQKWVVAVRLRGRRIIQEVSCVLLMKLRSLNPRSRLMLARDVP